MTHQTDYLALTDRRREYALFGEQGTGKTVMLLAEAERFFLDGRINALLVVAPNGVHTNWTRREIPKHLSCPHASAAYRAGRRKSLREITELQRERGLRIMAINIDAARSGKGYDLAQRFLAEHKALMVVDESARIKNPKSAQSKAIHRLGRLANARRIATGTPLTNSPPDLWSQFEFLRPGMLGIRSYRAFVAEFAHLLSPAAARRMAPNGRGEPPQIIVRDAKNNPRWRNLDKLTQLIAPHCFRVLKKDCTDLPPKVYSNRYFDLTPVQQQVYNQLRDEHLIDLGGPAFEVLTVEEPLAVKRLAVLTKLQQATSGFVLVEGEPREMRADNPRLKALMSAVEDTPGQFIVWARFKAELRAIAATLRKAGIVCVEYHGDTSASAREEAVDDFQKGTARAFVANAQAGSEGLTLTAATTAIYYSNSFNLSHRLQSEDRCHRIGTTHSVNYIDLVAMDTVDETITSRLQHKIETADAVLDPLRKRTG
jgi:SNF2 family DNA or RNA helicase